jgi:hypothetical protein
MRGRERPSRDLEILLDQRHAPVQRVGLRAHAVAEQFPTLQRLGEYGASRRA